MKVTIEVRDCLTKVSPTCNGKFEREARRGRPPVSCPACQQHIVTTKMKPVAKPKTSREVKMTVVSNDDATKLTRECPCGNSFQIKAGRGRKATKCDDCREAGTVDRTSEDGSLEAIRAETLRREQEEKAIQAGKDRANRLFDLMAPLLKKKTRTVIIH